MSEHIPLECRTQTVYAHLASVLQFVRRKRDGPNEAFRRDSVQRSREVDSTPEGSARIAYEMRYVRISSCSSYKPGSLHRDKSAP